MIEPPAECTECARLRQQARVALLSDDKSRLTDVRVLLRRHVEADHTVAVSLSAGTGRQRPKSLRTPPSGPLSSGGRHAGAPPGGASPGGLGAVYFSVAGRSFREMLLMQ